MRIARLFDVQDAAGEWTFAAGRPRITDAGHRALVARFLRGGAVVLRVAGSDADRIEPANGPVVPLSTLTDGTWIWGAALGYYVQTHGIAPEPDLLAHMAAHEYVAARPDESARRAAVAALMA